MSFLRTLGRIGKGVLGGLSGGPLGAAIGAGGAIAGSIAQGRQNRRDVEGGQQFQLDATRNSQTLDAQQASLEAERRRMRQMIAGDLLGSQSRSSDPRAQPFMSGGQIDPATLERMRSSATRTAPDISMPQFSERPRGGKLDSFLNILGGTGALAQLLQNRPKPDDPWAEIHGPYDNAGY